MNPNKSVSWPESVWTGMAILWFALFPLWQSGSYANITFSKLVGMVILLSLCLLSAAVTWLVLRRRNQLCRHTRWNLSHSFLIAYLFWVVFSALFGSWADSVNARGLPAVWFGAVRYEGALTQLCYGVIFLILSLVPIHADRWMDSAAIALLLFCGIIVIQYAGLNPLGLFPPGTSLMTHPAFQGTMGNSNLISAYFSLTIPLLTVGFVQRGRPLWLIAAFFASAIMACIQVQSGLIALFVLLLFLLVMLCRPQQRQRAILAITGITVMVLSRQAFYLPWIDGAVITLIPERLWLPLGAAVLGAAALFLARNSTKPWKISAVFLIFSAIGGILLAFIAFFPIPSASGGLWELHELLQGRPSDSFGSGRLGLWRNTLELCQDSPLFGTGPDTYYYAMQDYLQRNGIAAKELFDSPHSLFLSVLSGSGWPALVLYLALLGSALIHTWRRRTVPGMLPCAAAICCYLAQGMFTFSICLVSPIFFALLGIACCTAYDHTA